MGDHIGVDLGSVNTAIEAAAVLDPGHGLAGNRMRRAGPVVLRPDAEWQQSLPKRYRRLSTVVSPTASRYGYSIRPGAQSPATIKSTGRPPSQG